MVGENRFALALFAAQAAQAAQADIERLAICSHTMTAGRMSPFSRSS